MSINQKITNYLYICIYIFYMGNQNFNISISDINNISTEKPIYKKIIEIYQNIIGELIYIISSKSLTGVYNAIDIDVTRIYSYSFSCSQSRVNLLRQIFQNFILINMFEYNTFNT